MKTIGNIDSIAYRICHEYTARPGMKSFQLQKTADGSRARATEFQTLHNTVQTPIFMPVATLGSVRSQTLASLESQNAPILLANTYHLWLRPGTEVIQKMGGLHSFMNWNRSLLTDSGGFQVFSLAHQCEIDDESARFRPNAHLPVQTLTPEGSIGIQKILGSDIMMVLDQCVPSLSDKAFTETAMHRTHLWAKRSLSAKGDSPQALFGIVQGGTFKDLRKQSAEFLSELPFDGLAIGGLAVGESKEIREDIAGYTTEFLPPEKPRYLMGVGTPIDLLEAVHRGIDMFDCIIPTALAQQGVAFTSEGKLDLRRGVYQTDDKKLDPICPCSTCRWHSKAYLHHLVKSKEISAWSLLSTHNLHFFLTFMKEAREQILNNTFLSYYEKKREIFNQKDPDYPAVYPKKGKGKNPRPTHLGNFAITTSDQGFSTLKHSSGEQIHSTLNPVIEAKELYLEQSRLLTYLSETEKPTVLWDVGLGSATNAMVAILSYEKLCETKKLAPLTVISFENDLDALTLALEHPDQFPFLKHAAPYTLLKDGIWQSKTLPLKWVLKEGDFCERIEDSEAADFIYYDPFSYKSNPRLWNINCFEKIFDRNRFNPCLLLSYSTSTAVRATLLNAGFYVAKGKGSGPKSETTVAMTPVYPHTGSPFPLIGKEWLGRWEKSSAKFPEELDENQKKIIRRKNQKTPAVFRETQST